MISSKTINYFGKSAQIIVFFKNNTEKKEIDRVQSSLEKSGLLESIKYISETQAIQIYKDFYHDYPSLTQSVTTEDVFPSLEIRGRSVTDIPKIKELAEAIAKENPNIDSIMYFKDLVQKLKGISNAITVGGGILLVALSTMSVMLILITIGFNINAHKHEIEVMHLIGSSDSYIKTPFLLEGVFYGVVGSTISITILLIIWYLSMSVIRSSEIFLFISPTFANINMSYLLHPNILFIIIILFTEVIIGAIIGYISSTAALWKYLK